MGVLLFSRYSELLLTPCTATLNCKIDFVDIANVRHSSGKLLLFSDVFFDFLDERASGRDKRG